MSLTSITLAALLPLLAAAPNGRVYHAQGEMAGNVTATTAIFQSRLTAVPGLKDGDVPGAHGWGKFQYSETADFAAAAETEWLESNEASDFIVRKPIAGLQPGKTYYYRLVFGPDREQTEIGPTRQFKTLPAPESPVPVRFVVGNCMNYSFFMNGPKNDGKGARADADDRRLGYPSIASILKLRPDFFIGAGDNVYYDHPAKTAAKTLPELRRKWHEQFAFPRIVDMVGNTATFWIKDDHDYRFNDADPTGNQAPSHELGIRTFREQMPVVFNPADPTYRTLRCGQWLQVWTVEGRDFRSPNNSLDGPEKSIWGAKQKAWLQRTILASDAPFKILVTPTPMVGPDDAYKRDNHASPEGFRHEADEFFAFLSKNRVRNFYLVTGDRHWHYHSIHPSGYEELSCGALNTENARLGRAPGDPKSSDPDAKIKQLYTDAKPTGGYILVELTPDADGRSAGLRFSLQDEQGKELYAVVKRSP